MTILRHGRIIGSFWHLFAFRMELAMVGHIFVSYRHTDGQAAARLYDRLLEHFERDDIFMDVSGIPPGVDFVAKLGQQLSGCGTFLAVIGPGWIDAHSSPGERRLDDPRDLVRIEIETALKRDIHIIPVLVDGAKMPREEELPASLKAFVRR